MSAEFDLDGVPEVPRVERLSLKPGDRLVLLFEKYLSESETEHVKEQLRAHGFPAGTLILDGGAKLQVLESAAP